MALVRPLALTLLPLVLLACNPDDPSFPDPKDDIPSDPAPPNFGTWLSMDVAPDGDRLVISYYDRDFGALGFAIGTPSGETVDWYFEQIDGYGDPSSGLDVGDRGQYSSMKVAPDGTVWIAYYDATMRQLMYAHRTGGPKSWVTGVVDAGPNVGTWASLALDGEGNPVIAYHDETAGSLKVAKIAGAGDADGLVTWTTEVAATGTPFAGGDTDGEAARPADVGEHARLAIIGGTEFIAYYDKGQQRLALVQRAGGGPFSGGPVSPEGVNAGQWPSILRDGDTLFIAYHDMQNQNLMVASGGINGWVNEIADAGDFVGADTEIVKRGGKIGVLYFDGMNNNQKFAAKQGSVWVTQTIAGDEPGTQHPLGFHNEIVRIGDTWWAASYDFSAKSVTPIKLLDE